jgi:malate synthase
MVRQDILQKFPELFGAKKVNGRDVNVEDAITTLTRELRPAIAAALSARRETLQSPAPVRQKYGWPKWDATFEDPVTGKSWTQRRRSPHAQPGTGVDWPVASAGHGFQRLEQSCAHEHAGF